MTTVPGERVALTAAVFHADSELADLVNDRPASLPPPSDDPELDEFATRMLDAFSRVDAVEVPDIGRFELREKEARRCATVDGDPTIVARRRIVAFVAAQELKKALNSTVPATDVPRGLAARQQHPHLTRAHRPAEHRLKAMEFIGRGRRDFEPPKRYGDRHVLDAEADEVDIGEPL